MVSSNSGGNTMKSCADYRTGWMVSGAHQAVPEVVDKGTVASPSMKHE